MKKTVTLAVALLSCLAAATPAMAQGKGDHGAQTNVAAPPSDYNASPSLKQSFGLIGNLGMSAAWHDADVHYNNATTEGEPDGVNGTGGAALRYYLSPWQAMMAFLTLEYDGYFGDVDADEYFANLHPGAGNDTGAFIDPFWALRMGFGLMVMQWQEASLWFRGGAMAQGVDLVGVTDETGGGGVRNTFRRGDTLWGGYVGVEGQVPLRSVAQGTNTSLVFGLDLTKVGETSVHGTSTLGNTYNFHGGNGIGLDTRIGLQINF